MPRLSRRVFLMSAAALAGCRSTGNTSARQGPAPPVRPPSAGQWWRYAKSDVFSRVLIDQQVDTVATVGATVDIESRSEPNPPSTKSSWGSSWLKKYALQQRHDEVGPLPGEIQDPWGRVRVDPHWAEVQVYETPIPLWPSELRAGWSNLINTRYQTPSNQSGLPWTQEISAQGWESISVPAGRFKALRFTNLINFRSTDLGRTASQRQEIVWFVPEIGRWAARQSTGSYYRNDSLDDLPISETGFRWELLSFT